MTKPINAVVLTCYAPPALAQWIKQEAQRQDISKSECIKRILSEAQQTKPNNQG